jgi:dTDP-4-amino-4,6-dideoxygalactose transaminase
MRPALNLIPRFNLDYNFSDFLYAIKSTFNRDNVEMGPLHRIFGDKTFLFTNTGRSSLYLILRALNLPKGSKIGVPLYSCTVVFDAILKAGHIPYFIDIDLDNYTLDPEDLAEKIDSLSAVVVIHTFGRPADMDRIKEVAGDVPVIEDCAHSLLSRCGEEQTGTLSFASFFSFKKYLSMGEGGMIILNNDEFMDGFQREIDSLDSFTTINEIKDAFVTYGHSFLYHKPWFGLFSYPIGSYMRNIVGQNDGAKNFKANKIRKMHLNLLFKKLNGFGDRVELQRKNSFILLKELGDTSLILPYEKKDTYCNYYLFPIRFNNRKERDEAHVRLRAMNVDTAKLYSETPMKARRFYGYKGDCPNSEIVADTVLIIPNHYTLAEKNLIKIIDSIRKERLL